MIFRFARHTNDLERLLFFYTTILDLDLLGSFKNHNDYEGIFLGKQNLDWHLEFTKTNEIVSFNFNDDDVLVFYPETQDEYDQILLNISESGSKTITAKNPYWNENGKMVLDPDGYRIIISNLKVK